MSTEPITGLTYQEPGSLQTDALQNAEVNYLGAWLNCSVIDMTSTAPPGSPTNGDRYIVAATATGAWAGHEDDLAVYRDGWQFYTPKEGDRLNNVDDGGDYLFTGGAWGAAPGGGGAGTGDVVGPASSTTNHVALFADGTGKEIKDGGALAAVALSGDAADVAIADAGGYFTGTDVEAALQEAGAVLDGLGTASASDTGDFATAAQGALADSALQPNAPITGATKTKITYDADGLVTAGADATTADIADSTDKRYVTDAELVVIGNTSGTNTGDQTSVTGNAGTATALQNARTIGGVSFDGTANIDLPGVNTTGNQNTTGSAATLTTSRNIGGIAFNGSANIEPSVSEVSRTTSWTLGLSDRNTLQVQTHASPQTCTIPPQSSVTWVGPTTILILAHGSGALTLDADTGVTLNGVSGGSVALDRYQNAVLRWISSDVWVVSGTSADVA